MLSAVENEDRNTRTNNLTNFNSGKR